MRFTVRKTVAAGLIVVGQLALPMAAAAETLADALAGAYNHSGLLDQNRALLRAADEDVAIAIAALRPIISWSGNVTRTFGTSSSASTLGTTVGSASNTATINLSADLTLIDFGRSKLAIDAAKESVLGTRETLIGVEQNILLNAVSAFMNVRRETENVALGRNNVRLITEELRAARDRFEVGEVTRTDVALAEARLASSKSALAAAQGNLAQAVASYHAAIGRKPGTLKAPTKVPTTASSVEKAMAIAVRTHPSIKQVQHAVAEADINIMRAKAEMKPNVTLNGTLSVTENLDNSNFSRGGTIGVNAGGPIYRGGELSALLRQAMAGRDAQRGNLHVVRHQVQQDVRNAFALLDVARASRVSSAEQIRAAEVAFRGVREEATLGSRTTLDVLDAEQELLDARAGLISAVVDEYIAAYRLLSAMGLLTAEHLGLKVQRYDPAEYYNLVKNAPTVSSQGEKLDRVLKALGKK